MRPQDAVANPPTASTRPACHSERTRQPRAVRRVAYRVPCRVRLIDEVTGEVHTVAGETVNLSRQGMALQVGLDVPIGTWVETLVPHPNGDPMFLCGTVVHSRRTMKAGFEIGVETNRPETFV
jgi:hypothetical protein